MSAQPRFQNTFCSQCGQEFGPGEHGFSHCENHRGGQRWGDPDRRLIAAREQAARVSLIVADQRSGNVRRAVDAENAYHDEKRRVDGAALRALIDAGESMKLCILESQDSIGHAVHAWNLAVNKLRTRDEQESPNCGR